MVLVCKKELWQIMNKLIQKYKNMSVSLKATLWFTVSNMLQKGVMFLTVPIFTRILSGEEYGNYSTFLSWLEIFEILATFRLGWGGYIVGLNKYEDDRGGYTSSMQMLSFTITTVAFGIYWLARGPIEQLVGLDTRYMLVIFGLMYIIPIIQFWTVRERVEIRYKNVLLVTVVSSILFVLVSTIVALGTQQEKDLSIVMTRLVVHGGIALVLLVLNCKERFVFFDKTYWKRALQFNVPLLPYYLSMVVLHSSDRIIIKDLIGKTQAGIYNVAYIISSCMQLFNTSITQTLQPWLYKQMKDGNVKKVPQIILATTGIVAILNLILIALAPEMIWIAAPSKYKESVWIIPPLAASVFVMYFYQHFINIEFYFEESGLTAIASCGAAVLNVALNYWLIPRYGYFAAGYTTLISYLVFAVFHYVFMRKVCKKNHYEEKLIDMKGMVLIAVAFFALAAVLMVGYKYPIIRYTMVLIIGIVGIIKRNLIMDMIGKVLQSKMKGKEK